MIKKFNEEYDYQFQKKNFKEEKKSFIVFGKRKKDGKKVAIKIRNITNLEKEYIESAEA